LHDFASWGRNVTCTDPSGISLLERLLKAALGDQVPYVRHLPPAAPGSANAAAVEGAGDAAIAGDTAELKLLNNRHDRCREPIGFGNGDRPAPSCRLRCIDPVAEAGARFLPGVESSLGTRKEKMELVCGSLPACSITVTTSQPLRLVVSCISLLRHCPHHLRSLRRSYYLQRSGRAHIPALHVPCASAAHRDRS
jgi:hypothetical protein